MRAARWGTVMLLALALAAACSGQTSGQTSGQVSGQTSGPTSGPVAGEITVLAAASLTEVFTDLGRRFEAEHPGTRVRLSFGPSSGLAEQIVQGAPADVFASAGPKNMQQVIDAGAGRGPRVFATNRLQLAVPPGNPARIAGVGDLARPGVKLAVCQAQVPCGALAVAALAGVRVKPVTEEADVKAVLAKVRLGEVDAGLVYRTDVLAAGAGVRGIDLPAGGASTAYPVVALARSENPATARAFAELVLSAAGRARLAAAGFGPP